MSNIRRGILENAVGVDFEFAPDRNGADWEDTYAFSTSQLSWRGRVEVPSHHNDGGYQPLEGQRTGTSIT